MLHLHECDRFKAQGLVCPFRRFREDDEGLEREEDAKKDPELPDPDDDDHFQYPFVIKRKQQQAELDNLRQLPVIAHGDPAMRKALERMAAIKKDGGLPSLPNIPIPNFPLQGVGHQEIISVLAAIAIMNALRGMRSMSSGTSFPAVQGSERHAARGLSKVLNRQSGVGRTKGRGGLHVNAAADLQKLLGFRRKLGPGAGGPVAGFDSFSETGFN